jgi:peptide/nickel transport system ATP-binding protein
VRSVPVFGEKWAGEIGLSDLETREYALTACKFAPRCPYRREICAQRKPPRVERAGGREALCFKPADYREE